MDPIRSILVVDDVALYRRGLSAFLAEAFAEAIITETTPKSLSGKAIVGNPHFDLIIVDVGGEDAAGLVSDLVAAWPESPVIVLSAANDLDVVREALAAGAAGYILKSVDSDTLRAAIRIGADNDNRMTVMPSTAAMFLCQRQPAPAELLPPADLSLDQAKVLKLVADGLSNKQIAARLDMPVDTVKLHLRQVMRKIGVNNRTRAALWVREQAQLSPADDLRPTIAGRRA